VIVSEVIEVDSELGDPNCKLIKPFLLDQVSFELTKWLNFSNQNEIMIRSEDILTFADPIESILKKYLENQ
jgi:hypothetical protein